MSEGIGLKANYINKANTEKHVEKKYGKLLMLVKYLWHVLRQGRF